ncbi:energy-coupling factor transporter transmembrane component T family protein [Shewanella sp. 0m-8]
MRTLTSALNDFRAIDDYSRQETLINRLDARAKLISSVAILMAVVSQDSYAIAALLPLYLYPMVILVTADIPMRFILPKLLLALPFIILLGILNPLLDTSIWQTPWGSYVSAGWLSLMSIILRLLLCVSIAILLLATTGIQGIVAGLQRLAVPNVLTTQIYLLYQFFFIIAQELLVMLNAYQLRRINRQAAIPLHFYQHLMISLFHKTVQRCTRIYEAMLARGFRGELKQFAATRWSSLDTVWTLFWCTYGLLCRLYNLPDALTQVLMR